MSSAREISSHVTAQSVTSVTIEVPLRRWVDDSYPVIIGRGLADDIAAWIVSGALKDTTPVIITDDTVRAGMAGAIRDAFFNRGFTVPVFSFPPGEQSKTRAVKEKIEDQLIDAGFGRDTVVLAVGGGVVTDLGGFVAATFTRGVALVNVPTTMLAAADASIGGKTSVDTPAATNLIGVFHQPSAVFIDLDTLATLPSEQIRTGLAETIKHACVADASLFDLLEDTFVTRKCTLNDFITDTALCAHVARRNVEIKSGFVSADVHEADLRMVLNLGHTFGRALEAAVDFTMPHGQAVGIGLMLQAHWGVQLGLLEASHAQRMHILLQTVGLATALPSQVSIPALMRAMSLDKKVRRRTVRFVFQCGIGAYHTFDEQQPCPPQHPHARTTRPASSEEIEVFLNKIHHPKPDIPGDLC